MTNLKTIAAAAIIASFGFTPGAMAASNGISALVQVTQLKSQDANEEALTGADKQRDLVQKKKAVRRIAPIKQTAQQEDTQSSSNK